MMDLRQINSDELCLESKKHELERCKQGREHLAWDGIYTHMECLLPFSPSTAIGKLDGLIVQEYRGSTLCKSGLPWSLSPGLG